MPRTKSITHLTEEQKARFWSRVHKGDECWPWTGAKTPAGYGKMNVSCRHFYAHRISYVLTFGDIPDNLFVCHTCDTPSCCNPSHLFAGTNQDNVTDRNAKGRTSRATGMKKRKLNPQQVIEIRKMALQGHTATSLGKTYQISRQAISRILRGESYAI
jgi:hypothetical protein